MKINQVKMKFEPPAMALEKWNPNIYAADDVSPTINILSTVGEYGDGSGMTAKIVSSILRKADGADVVVNINSPGGDFFEGLAIHTLLKEYKGKVTVRVLALAASAASVVAMAGNDIEISKSGFIMIHNAWTFAIGNKGDMKEVAFMLEQFDDSMSDLYANRSLLDKKTIQKLMDAETFMRGDDAIANGFATKLIGDDVALESDKPMSYNSSLKAIDVALAKAGMPRSERRSLIKELTGTPCAAKNTTPCAGTELSNALDMLLKNLTKT